MRVERPPRRCAGMQGWNLWKPVGVVLHMATDFRDGKSFPRRGRQPIGEYLWLARLFDKARAAADGTIYDYIYPCPMDQGVMDRWGIKAGDFTDAVKTHTTDQAIYDWLKERVSPEQAEKANRWLLDERVENLDRQDSEEGVVVGRSA